jgi:hypothetical protein
VQRILHLASADLNDGTSVYWALADNVLATREHARRPLDLPTFRQHLNIRCLFSEHAVAPGICILKNRHLRTLVEKHDYGSLLRHQGLVPTFSANCMGFSQLYVQDREDLTAYRVKQDSTVAEYAQELDMYCTAAAPLDEEDFRDDLTEALEGIFSSRHALRELHLDCEISGIQSFVRAQRDRLPNRTLRRSVFFFLGDVLVEKRIPSGFTMKTRASAEYHKSIARQLDLELELPAIYGRPVSVQGATSIILDEDTLFIPLEKIGRLSANEIISIRQSDHGKQYFEAGRRHTYEGSAASEQSFENAGRAYADYIHGCITGLWKSGAPIHSVSLTGRCIRVGMYAIPFAVMQAHHYLEGGLLFSMLAAGEAFIDHLKASREERLADERQLRAIRKVSEWHMTHPSKGNKKPDLLI